MTSSLQRYDHTQVGVPTLVITGAAQAGIVIAAAASQQWAILWLLPLFVLVELLFFRLRVTVGDGTARAVFGIGVFRKEVTLARVASSHPMRNWWLTGWGIRYCGRRCWVYNISGLDAVEMRLDDGSRVRFGTDDPQGLHAAIETERGVT